VFKVLAGATAVATLGICLALLVASGHAPLVYWFGGWTPVGHLAIGIDFAIDPLGAGVAVLAASLTVAAFLRHLLRDDDSMREPTAVRGASPAPRRSPSSPGRAPTRCAGRRR
jgi:formate hydrogenlyase subunit 3/multisubunit Na+/H+ antiporter MnhD subunit